MTSHAGILQTQHLERTLKQIVDVPVPPIMEAAVEAIDAPVSRIQDDLDEVVLQLIPPTRPSGMRRRTSSSTCGCS